MVVKRMTKRQEKKAPSPKLTGVIRKTDTWRNTISAMEAGRNTTVELPKNFCGLNRPQEAFMQGIRRWIKRCTSGGWTVYGKEGVIYIVKIPR